MSGLDITVLGCSGTYAGAGGACSGYLLRTDVTSIWLDCGAGSLANLQRHLPLTALAGIVCTHSHPDHWLELPVANNALRYVIGARDIGIPLLWTAQTSHLFGVVSGHDPAPTFAAQVIDETATATIGDIDLRFSRTDHPVETLAVRADSGGRSIVYTADTGNDWSLASLGPGIDLAVVEATLDPDQEGAVQHLTGAQAGQQATEAGAGTLLLTHLAPGTDGDRRLAEARTTFAGPVSVAEIDGRYVA